MRVEYKLHIHMIRVMHFSLPSFYSHPILNLVCSAYIEQIGGIYIFHGHRMMRIQFPYLFLFSPYYKFSVHAFIYRANNRKRKGDISSLSPYDAYAFLPISFSSNPFLYFTPHVWLKKLNRRYDRKNVNKVTSD